MKPCRILQNKQRHRLLYRFEFEALGTHWKIDLSTFKGLSLEKEILGRVEKFDWCYSRFREDSLVSKWASEAGEYELPDDAAELLAFYKKLYDATDGLATPLIGRTMEQAGYDAQYSLKPQKLTAPPKWEEALYFPGWHPGNEENVVKHSLLVVKQPVLLDFGAAGKGYLVDILGELLRKRDVNQFVINAGGDILVSQLEQTLGLEDPDDDSRILGTVKIKNGALCSSAGNRRKWGRFHHIINPQTLASPRSVKATWVRAKTTMEADGLATALFFVSPERLLKTFSFDYAMIENGDLRFSKNFNAEWFLQ